MSGFFSRSWVKSLTIPFTLIGISALIVWGVTRLLSTERSPRDLIREMRSKTFGNRWIAAYELSKLIARKSLPKEDTPWVIEQLQMALEEGPDPKGHPFIVSALGAIGSPLAAPALAKALHHGPVVQFHAVVALGRLPPPLVFDWNPLLKLLHSPDLGLVQVTALTLATHKVPLAREELIRLTTHLNPFIRFSAGLGLINYREVKALPVLKDIFRPSIEDQQALGPEGLRQLQFNVLDLVLKNRWTALNPFWRDLLKGEMELPLLGKVKKLLKALER